MAKALRHRRERAGHLEGGLEAHRQSEEDHPPPNDTRRIHKAEIQEVKHDQNNLQEQNWKLHEEVTVLRAHIEAAPPAPPTRSWAEVAAGNNLDPQLNHQRPEKNQNCVRTSTQRSFVDPSDNGDRDTHSADTSPLSLPTPNPHGAIERALHARCQGCWDWPH